MFSQFLNRTNQVYFNHSYSENNEEDVHEENEGETHVQEEASCDLHKVLVAENQQGICVFNVLPKDDDEVDFIKGS